MSIIDEITEATQAIANGKQRFEATHNLGNFHFELKSSDKNIILQIKDSSIPDSIYSDWGITIYLINIVETQYHETLFREVVDLTARNYRGIKRNIKLETLQNIRGVYSKVTGTTIASKFPDCLQYEEMIEFLTATRTWSNQDAAFAYRVIASQSRNNYEYAIFIGDLPLVLEFFETNDDDFETLQFKLEEVLLDNV